MKILSGLIILLISVNAKAQHFIDQPYFFYSSEEGAAYAQSNDTLKVYSGFIPPRIPDIKVHPEQKYKILKVQKLEDDFVALKMKAVKNASHSNNKSNQNPYSVAIFEKTHNQIKLVIEEDRLSKDELKHFDFDELDYQIAFGLPFYSLTAIKDFFRLKKIKAQADFDKILEGIKNSPDKYKNLMDRYQKNKHFKDMYASAITGVLLTKICLDLGYNPHYAGLMIQVFEDHAPQEKIDKRLKLVYKDLGF